MSVAEHQTPRPRAKFVPWMDPVLKRFGKAPTPAYGRGVYCVGDVHGRDDLLAADGRAR